MRKCKPDKTDKLLREIEDNFEANDLFENDASITAKIKRLKIEESHLLKTLNSTTYTNAIDNNINDNNIYKFTSKLKELYENIKILFNDIEGSISSQEAIRSLDISEMEENIGELDEKIKYLKKYIELQLSPLKIEEIKLMEELNQNPSEIRIKAEYKTQGKKYKEIVPSPVRSLITSSLKSPEVQEFQDFISNSPNRFGGWNEYHHNIFVNCWRKYFQADCSTDIENFVVRIEKSNYFQQFLQELLRKLKCYKSNEITAHCKWYSRYMYLKERQQIAINKWRTNKFLIKKSTLKIDPNNKVTSRKRITQTSINQSITRNRFNLASSGQVVFDENNQHIMNKLGIAMGCGNDNNLPSLQYIKPTKQWLNRSQTIENSSHFCSSNVENLRKLRIPNWRIGL